MPKTHRSKPHQLKLSETAKPHELPAEDWFNLVNSGAARLERDDHSGRVAVLRLPFIGWIEAGQLFISRIGAAIPSTWLAWEREWLRRVGTIPARLLGETFEQRQARVTHERETALFIEALEWKSTRRKTRKNSIRWVSPEQLNEVLSAFHRLPEAVL